MSPFTLSAIGFDISRAFDITSDDHNFYRTIAQYRAWEEAEEACDWYSGDIVAHGPEIVRACGRIWDDGKHCYYGPFVLNTAF